MKIGSGFTPLGGYRSYQSSGIPLIRSQNVHMNRFEPEGLAYISEDQDAEMAGSRVCARDVLLNITGASIGRVCVAPDHFCPANVNQHVCVIRGDGTLDPDYLCLYFSSPLFQKFVWDSQAGATRQALTKRLIENLKIPLVELPEQKRIAARLRAQLAEVGCARKAAEAQLLATDALVESLLRQSLSSFAERPLSECLREVTAGVGEEWGKFPVIGATRGGVAPAKEPVGKNPHRYKPVVPGTIFYNPMRILLGSIAMIDDGDESGITSPDYVVMKGVDRVLHPRWFYYWFRSKDGAGFIKSLSRGAVRERLLFKRLAPASMRIPDWQAQETFAKQLIDIRKFKKAMFDKLADIEKLPTAILREAFTGAI